MSITLFHTALLLVWIATSAYLFYWLKVARFFLSAENKIPISNIQNLSLVCVFRNEELVLPQLLNSLQILCDHVKIPMLLINDHSNDASEQIIKKHPIYKQNLFQLINAPAQVQGKKQCLEWSIRHVITTQNIFITDADCTPTQLSISSLWNEHVQNQASLSLGLVSFSGGKSLLHQYQIIENTCLVALSTFHAAHKTPSMGNAANMIIKRNDFLEAHPYRENVHIAGGDDIFLIQALQKQAKKIHYSNQSKSVIQTETVNSWKNLWHQRIRWAQKSQFQPFGITQFSQILLVLFFILLWGICIGALLKKSYVQLLLLWFYKISGEAIFIKKIFSKLPEAPTPTILQIAGSSFTQFIFIPLVAFMQFFLSVHWKDRIVRANKPSPKR